MKILCFCADHTNSTDGVIVKGINVILSHVFEEYEIKILDVDADYVYSGIEVFENEIFDLIVIAGTPWIWDQFHLSIKWKNLVKIINTHNYSKKLFFGIGSCFFPEDEYLEIAERPAEQDAMREIYTGAKVIVRDWIAFNKLTKAGVNCELLVCPSYFCYGIQPIVPTKSSENVLIWYDPTIGVSSVGWKKQTKLEEYLNLNLDYFKEYKPTVYTHLTSEIKAANYIGLPEPKLIGGWRNTLSIMQNANYVLSGRVHCYVPAFVQGKPCGLLSVDSRSRVVSDFGGTVISNINQFKNLGYQFRNFDLYLNRYKDILKDIMNEECI